MGLEKIKGQDTAVNLIGKALESNSLGHAVLLEGPGGSGKTTLGFIMARALNCAEEGPDPCGICSSCRKIDNGVFPDLEILQPGGRWIKLDELRRARQNLQLQNQEGRYRILFIKEAHCLTREAAASLLKIMEEPPAGMKFILTTSSPFRMSDTVVSRCSRFKLHRIPLDLVRELLQEHYPGEPLDKREAAARISGGIPGRAFAIMEDEGWEERTTRVKELGRSLLQDGVAEDEILAEAREWSERGDLFELLQWLQAFFRDGLVAIAGGRDALAVDREHLHFWEQNLLPEYQVQECLSALLETEKTITTSNANVQLALENMFLGIKGRINRCITW